MSIGSPPWVSAMLKTEDMTATIAWYERVGFEILDHFPADGEPTWLELERDGVVVQFLGGERPGPSPRR